MIKRFPPEGPSITTSSASAVVENAVDDVSSGASRLNLCGVKAHISHGSDSVHRSTPLWTPNPVPGSLGVPGNEKHPGAR